MTQRTPVLLSWGGQERDGAGALTREPPDHPFARASRTLKEPTHAKTRTRAHTHTMGTATHPHKHTDTHTHTHTQTLLELWIPYQHLHRQALANGTNLVTHVCTDRHWSTE